MWRQSEWRSPYRHWGFVLVSVACIAFAPIVGCGESDTAAFGQAQTADTAEAYEDFITRFPESRLITAAKTRLDEARLARARDANTVASWQRYLDDQKEGPNIAQAQYELERLAFTEASRDKTGANLKAFLKRYPNGTFATAAQNKIDAFEAEAAGTEADKAKQ